MSIFKNPKKRERVFINLDSSPFATRPLTGMRNVVQMLTSPVVQSNIAVNFAISAADVCSRNGAATDLAWRLGAYAALTATCYATNRVALALPHYDGRRPVIDKSGMAGGDPALAHNARMGLLRAGTILYGIIVMGTASATRHGSTLLPLIQALSFPVMQGAWNFRAFYKIYKGDWTVQAAPPVTSRRQPRSPSFIKAVP